MFKRILIFMLSLRKRLKTLFLRKIWIAFAKNPTFAPSIYAMGCLPDESRGNYRLRSHPPNLIQVMLAKGWRKGITCLIGYLLTI